MIPPRLEVPARTNEVEQTDRNRTSMPTRRPLSWRLYLEPRMSLPAQGRGPRVSPRHTADTACNKSRRWPRARKWASHCRYFCLPAPHPSILDHLIPCTTPSWIQFSDAPRRCSTQRGASSRRKCAGGQSPFRRIENAKQHPPEERGNPARMGIERYSDVKVSVVAVGCRGKRTRPGTQPPLLPRPWDGRTTGFPV